jgi:hypothetical protein
MGQDRTSEVRQVDLNAYNHQMLLEGKESLLQVYPEALKRLERLRRLKPDWDSYDGLPPSEDTVEHAYLVLNDLVAAAESRAAVLPEPTVSPGARGTVQFSWKLNRKRFELEFSLMDNKARYEYLLCPEADDSTWEEDEFVGVVDEHPAVVRFLSWI